MARVIAVVMAAVFTTGCTSYKASKGTAQLGGALIMGTVLIGVPIAEKDPDIDAKEAAEVMLPIIVLGAVIGLLGVGGMVIHGAAKAIGGGGDEAPQVVEKPPQPTVDPVQQQLAADERRRRAAWDLTQQARIAAHRNDCPRVAYLAQRVVELDRPTFHTVFARDPYIVKCAPKPPRRDPPPRSIPIPPLDPTPPPQPPPATPAPAPTPAPTTPATPVPDAPATP